MQSPDERDHLSAIGILSPMAQLHMTAIVDLVWLFTASLMVLAMQAGFLMLEAGRVRSKNSINVAQKNVSDLILSWIVFFVFGYWLMFGVPAPLVDDDSLAREGQARDVLFFLYQLGFCATAASIVSGGIAERMSYVAYLVLVLLTAALIYPLAGRWVWGDLGPGWTGSWLADIGFVDFAGSTVVHGVGAWIALAGIVVIGPRLERFSPDGSARPIAGHNAVFSLLGVLILLLGWFGFNGGSISPSDPLFVRVMLATSIAACFGAFAGMVVGVRLDRGIFNPSRMTSGLLGGLVAITACVHLTSSVEAMFVGVAGGLVATLGADWLLVRWRIDDPVDVIATHGFAGVVGTVAVAFVGSAESLPAGTRLAQAAVQIGGVVVIFLLAFVTTYVTLRILSRIFRLRVTAAQERLGLNHTEHGQALGAERLQRALDERFEGSVDADGLASVVRPSGMRCFSPVTTL